MSESRQRFIFSSHRVAVVCLLLLGLSGCAHRESPPALDVYTQEYLRLAVSLGERDPDSLDFYFGPESTVSEARNHPPKVDAIRQQAIMLSDQLRQLPSITPQSDRIAFLVAQLDAIALRAQLLTGNSRSFDEESQIFFHVVSPPDNNTSSRARTRSEIAALLGNLGTPSHTYTTFDARFIVPQNKVPDVMQEALRQCRAKTIQHITLPATEHVDVEYVSHKPWSAFSHYRGNAHSVIQLNMDLPHTVDRLLDLACHEGYPGHHVFNTLRDQSFVQSMHRDEWLAQTTFSPQSFLSEAAASYAPELAFPFNERLRVERDVLFPIAGLNPHEAEHYLRVQQLIASLQTAQPAIARDFLDGHLEFVRAAAALEHETLMEHAEGMLLYFNEYRTYMLAYTFGHDQMRNLIDHDNLPASARWQRFQQLMTQPITSFEQTPH